jgi:hypothetical protein
MQMFKDIADIQTADMLNLPVPEAKFETIVVEPSELQKEMVEELSERAAAVHSKMVDATVDNLLKITTDGRKIGLEQRLMNPLLPDFEGSKVNACTENICRIWSDTGDKRLTQLVFCDFSTPNSDGRFNVYDDIKAKLIERGVPEHEVAFIHDADTEAKKKELFAKVRQGKVAWRKAKLNHASKNIKTWSHERSTEMSTKNITVKIGPARIVYPHLWTPYGSGEKKKFSASFLIPKDDAAAKAQIDEAVESTAQIAVQLCLLRHTVPLSS